MSIGFTLLGDVTIRSRGADVAPGSPRQRCVLALLLIDVNRPVSAQTLLTRVWGDNVPARAMASLYSYLSRLRALRSDPGDAERWDIVRTPAGYVLRTDSTAVDLFRFRSLVEQARGANDPREAEASYGRALALWQGEPFAGLRSPWLDAYRLTLAEEHQRARLDHYELLLNRGRHVDLVQPLTALAAEQPLDEQVAHLHMLALYRTGQPAAAVTAYGQLRQRLVERLGVDPGPQLQELHQRILSFDDALAAPPAAAPERRTPRQLPACPSGFVGRGDALRLLDVGEGRVDGAAPDVRVIAGMAGVGKSWLALQWAHQHLERFPDGQLYVNLRGYDPVELALAPQTALRGFLESLGVPAQEIPYDENACAGLYRSLVADRRLLIILDNARDTAHVTPLLPGGHACTVLVTSRHRLAGLTVENGAGALPLDMLSREEARQLLAHRLGPRAVDAEPEAVESLLDHCAGLPLALGIAAARAAGQSDRPLAALAAELSEALSRLDALESGEPTIGLRAVLETSYRALDSGNAHALALLGLIPGPDISLLAAASLIALPLADARVVLRRLESASLVSRHRQDRYRMHDLIHLYAAECGAQDLSEEARNAALDRLFGFYVHTSHTAAALLHPHRATVSLPSLPPGCVPDSPTDSAAAQAWMRAERACLISAQAAALTQCRHAVVWQLAYALDPFLQRQGASRENVASWRSALAAADRIAVPEIRGLAHQRAGQALAYAGDHSAAVTELTRALELFEQLEDVDGRMRTHRSLAIAWEQQGCHAEALTHLERALSLIDDDTLTRGHVLNAMGWCQAHLGDFARAQEHCTQALALVDRHDDHHGAAIVRDSLGYIAHRTGRHEAALTHYRAALGLFRGAGDSRQEVAVLRDMGDVHKALHEYEQARLAWTKALDLSRAQQRATIASLQQRLGSLTGRLD